MIDTNSKRSDLTSNPCLLSSSSIKTDVNSYLGPDQTPHLRFFLAFSFLIVLKYAYNTAYTHVYANFLK
jgi:hypothetical protein